MVKGRLQECGWNRGNVFPTLLDKLNSCKRTVRFISKVPTFFWPFFPLLVSENILFNPRITNCRLTPTCTIMENELERGTRNNVNCTRLRAETKGEAAASSW